MPESFFDTRLNWSCRPASPDAGVKLLRQIFLQCIAIIELYSIYMYVSLQRSLSFVTIFYDKNTITEHNRSAQIKHISSVWGKSPSSSPASEWPPPPHGIEASCIDGLPGNLRWSRQLYKRSVSLPAVPYPLFPRQACSPSLHPWCCRGARMMLSYAPVQGCTLHSAQ